MASTSYWKPLSFMGSDFNEPFSLVILNQPILIKKELMVQLWNRAAFRITVDGGTDRWFDLLEGSETSDVKNLGLPDLISGDLDSIKPETLEKMKEKSIEVEFTYDQNYPDFYKAVQCLKERNAPNLIVAICEVSGRLDQVLSQLNTLHMREECISLLSSSCTTWLLKPGSHEIDVSDLINSEFVSAERWIGLLPVGAPVCATTSGLKWDLDNTVMKFGGLVSSSNTYGNDSVIKVKTDQPLVWSMGLCLSKKTT